MYLDISADASWATALRTLYLEVTGGQEPTTCTPTVAFGEGCTLMFKEQRRAGHRLDLSIRYVTTGPGSSVDFQYEVPYWEPVGGSSRYEGGISAARDLLLDAVKSVAAAVSAIPVRSRND